MSHQKNKAPVKYKTYIYTDDRPTSAVKRVRVLSCTPRTSAYLSATGLFKAKAFRGKRK